MLITAHQGALPPAPLGEVPKDIAAASAAIPNVNFERVFVTTLPHWFPVVLKHRKEKTNSTPPPTHYMTVRASSPSQ
jgi:hypothetical protein